MRKAANFVGNQRLRVPAARQARTVCIHLAPKSSCKLVARLVVVIPDIGSSVQRKEEGGGSLCWQAAVPNARGQTGTHSLHLPRTEEQPQAACSIGRR